MRGKWKPKLDDKFRLTLPAQYRAELASGVTVVCAQENCLAVYVIAVLEEILKPINAAPSTLVEVRDYQRWMQYSAVDTIPDKQGRIILTFDQRKWAELEREVVIIGAGDRLEVWNPDRWDAYALALDAKFTNFNGEIVPRS